ncbi:FHF complex subunit HOOK interacting protein 2B isoform X2 [Bombina bombina]|uniref:FHF complex subunit HOOK interacting protein 2B isoform X2 n=1 Tax=Bombina bombina TaxID=8345 RepID=UPI00235A79DB|nr:FHF complex subunit HOOK interacting protein 2B isoform X2 [Bombina bombina]
MLSRLGSFLQQALESREPTQDLLQSFVQHWRGVTQYYLENTDESRPARDTEIPWRLRQLIDILAFEEREPGSNGDTGNSGTAGHTGPCMEYLLQHKILETLCTLAKAEYPPGMRQQVLLFYSRLLSQVQRPLLHYLNVHRPVQKLIALSGDEIGITAQKEELHFLSSVCSKLEKDPSLLIHILEGENVREVLCSAGEDEGKMDSPNHKPRQNLFRALMRLCNCQKSRLTVRAREALLGVLRSAQEEGPARLIAQSDLKQLITERMCELHSGIPLTTHPCDITALEGTDWRTEPSTQEADAALRRFLCWVEYCNCLVRESNEVVAVSLAESLAEGYLRGILQPELLQVSELGILRSTAILTALIQRLTAYPLLHRLLTILLGEERGPESKSVRGSPLRTQIIQRCNHLSDEISLASLRLFEEILQVPQEFALHNLVIRNLETRMYLTGAQEEIRGHEGDNWEFTEELEEDPYFTDGFPDTGLRLKEKNTNSEAEPAGREQRVRSFLSLVPEEMKSSDSGYDTYLQDALVQFQSCCNLVSQWGWPISPRTLTVGHGGQEFYEGHFLEVLFDRLGGILDQPYEMNLQVTSLLGRLALFPHPHLQEFLLDPYISLVPGARSLFSVLVRVVADLAQRSLHVSRFQETLYLVRRQLLGDAPEEPLNHVTMCRGVVVLEEFCKEMAAAACVSQPPLAPN